jgi:predicted N-acetyltransferase YhbS
MNIEIRSLTRNDIPVADQILSLAFGTPGNRAEELRRCLALQPDGWRLAICQGQPVGTVGAVDYGPFAWIGLMAVHPEQQHGGIGGLLMADILSWLDQRGCPLVRLDATQAGARLYRKLGFVGVGYTHLYQDPKFAPLPDNSIEVAVVEQADLPEIAALDETIFGASRHHLLVIYWNEFPDRFLVARTRRGELSGYLVVQGARLGPWVCTNPLAAEALLQAAFVLPCDGPLRLIVPDENTAARRLIHQVGFVEGPSYLHMVRGKSDQLTASSDQPNKGVTLPGKREYIYAQASFTLG